MQGTLSHYIACVSLGLNGHREVHNGNLIKAGKNILDNKRTFYLKLPEEPNVMTLVEVDMS